MANAKKPEHQVPQVPKRGGGTQDRSRNEDGRWREKRSDTGKHHQHPGDEKR